MGSRGLEPAAPCGRKRRVERRKSQGAPFMARLCEFPGLNVPWRVWAAAQRFHNAKHSGLKPPCKSSIYNKPRRRKHWASPAGLCKYLMGKERAGSPVRVDRLVLCFRGFGDGFKRPGQSRNSRFAPLRLLLFWLRVGGVRAAALRPAWGAAPNPARDFIP